MVFNVTFNHISVMSWRSVLLIFVEDPEKTTELSQVTENFYHKIVKIKKWKRRGVIVAAIA
jgi:hypothetical protein